jgi:hypothetical protein
MAQANTGPGHTRMQSRSLGEFAADQPARCLDDRVPAEVNRELATFLRAERKGAGRIDSHFVAAADSLSQFVLGVASDRSSLGEAGEVRADRRSIRRLMRCCER